MKLQLPLAPEKIALAQVPTPMRPLDRYSRLIGGPRIWVKCDDLTGGILSGNKVRKLEYLAADALNHSADVLITCGGMQSNHCRATAAVAAQLGKKAHLIIRGPIGLPERTNQYSLDELKPLGLEGNLLLDYLLGASISIYSPKFYAGNLEGIFKEHEREYSENKLKTYSIPTGGSNAVGLWGYIQAFEEIKQDCESKGIEASAIVCASGSGGTQGGLTLGAYLSNINTPVIGMAVCDSAEYFENKIREDVKAWQTQFAANIETRIDSSLSILTNDKYIGPGYAKGYHELYECIKKLASTEGLVLDPVYTGKAFYGMVSEIKKGNFPQEKDIVFVHTGGIYGVFPFKNALFPTS